MNIQRRKMEFVKGTKGSLQIVLDGYVYVKNKTLSSGITYWECTQRRSIDGCKGRIVVAPDDVFLRQACEHSHPPDPEKVAILKSRGAMKTDAESTKGKTQNILTTNLAGLSDATLCRMPKVETMRRDIRRHKTQNPIVVPADHDTLFHLPQQYTQTSTGEPFLIYDNQRRDRMLMFGTRRSMAFLRDSEHWFMDGTFASAPLQFAQLYTVHAYKENRNVVCAYGLLPNKRADTYVEFLNEIEMQTNNAIPDSIMIDYEAGMIRAIDQVFPYSPARGCLFHLSKSVFRKVQSLGLQPLYNNDLVFRENIRMLSAISFVPTQDIVATFDELAQHCGNAEQPVLDYFETNYIGELRRGRRLPPLFQHALWNVNTRVHDDLPRSNNHLEGWHNRFSSMFHGAHPPIWDFIESLQRDSALNHMVLGHIAAGAPAPPQKLVYRNVNIRLQALVQGYNVANRIHFLRGISYNLI